MITITTVLKTSERYTADWVDIMKSCLERYMTTDFQFVPLSDFDHTYSHIQFEQDNPGFWNKIELFRPGLWNTPVLFLDLDTVITGDLTDIIQCCHGKEFLMFRGNPSKKDGVSYPSSPVMYWEKCPTELWRIWNSQDAQHWYKKYSGGRFGDQAFIRDHCKFELIQDCMPAGVDYFCTDRHNYTSNTRLIILGGPSKKPDTSQWAVIREHWHI